MVLGGAHDQCPLDQQVQLLGSVLGPGVTEGLVPAPAGTAPPPVGSFSF